METHYSLSHCEGALEGLLKLSEIASKYEIDPYSKSLLSNATQSCNELLEDIKKGNVPRNFNDDSAHFIKGETWAIQTYGKICGLANYLEYQRLLEEYQNNASQKNNKLI